MSDHQAYHIWGVYSDPEHAKLWLPDLATFLEARFPEFVAQLSKEMKEKEDLDFSEVVDSRHVPFWVIQAIGARLREDWIADDKNADAFVVMALTAIAYKDCGCGECTGADEEEEADDDNCPIHGPKYGDDICADCHKASCAPPTAEEMAHWHSHEADVSTCWGCRENQPNQMAHTDPGGCLFAGYDADEIY